MLEQRDGAHLSSGASQAPGWVATKMDALIRLFSEYEEEFAAARRAGALNSPSAVLQSNFLGRSHFSLCFLFDTVRFGHEQPGRLNRD